MSSANVAYTAYNFDPTILREYDIRGTVGQDLNPSDANAIGLAFGSMVRRQGGTRVAVGYDGRVSSPLLSDHLVLGLMATGLEVVRIGLGPTPMLYFAVKHLKLDGGIMVTGSHNPPDMNGFKMMLYTRPFYGADIQEIGKIAAAGDFVQGTGSARDQDVRDDYVDVLVNALQPGGRTLNVAWDAGNGAAGEIMTRLTQRLPGQHTLLFADIDGNFPNHHPDPTVEKNLMDLKMAVYGQECDLGVAFDGDGDRVGVVDNKGRVLWGDQLMMIWAAEVLAENPGATIIADVKASQSLFDEIARLGGQPQMWKCGHSLVKAKMAELKSPLAGEMSGHIFFADKYYGFDDGLYAAMRLINILAHGNMQLSQWRDAMPETISTPEIRFACAETRKFNVIDEIRDRLQANGADMIAVDGVRVMTADGWWLIRASNTQPVLVARCEATTAEGLERLKALLVTELTASGVDIPAELQTTATPAKAA